MRTLKSDYKTPQIINQGSAITKTAATTSGSCYDGSPFTDDQCPCSGSGSSCKAQEE